MKTVRKYNMKDTKEKRNKNEDELTDLEKRIRDLFWDGAIYNPRWVGIVKELRKQLTDQDEQKQKFPTPIITLLEQWKSEGLIDYYEALNEEKTKWEIRFTQ